MVATILYRFAGKPALQGTQDYTDNVADTWYTDALKWTAQKGLASDFTDITFKPSVNLTREEMVTMLYKFTKLYGKNITTQDNLNGFHDAADVSEYDQWAVKHGIIQGTTNGLLLPKSDITRAEIAAIFHRFMEMK